MPEVSVNLYLTLYISQTFRNAEKHKYVSTVERTREKIAPRPVNKYQIYFKGENELRCIREVVELKKGPVSH